MNQSYRPRAIRLAFAALFWRLMIGFTLLFALVVGRWVTLFVPEGQRLILFLFVMPYWAGFAFAIAAALTLAASIVVGLFVRPRLLAWQNPPNDQAQAPFHLDSREPVRDETPARMATGRRWAAGRLVLTDRRLLFLAHDWDLEPWSARRDQLSSRTVESPRLFWGLVTDLPPRLEVIADGDAPRRFALPDAPVWSRRLEPQRAGILQ